MFFISFPTSFIGITVSVYHLCLTMDLIIKKLTLNSLIQSLQLEHTSALPLSISKTSSINISISIFDFALTLKMTLSELSFILLFPQGVDSMTMFMIILKITFIYSSVSFSYYTSSMLFTVYELSFILRILIEMPKISLTMEPIILKITLIFKDTSHRIFSFSMLLSSFIKVALICSTITLLNSTVTQVSVTTIKLTSKFLSIIKYKLTICSHSDTVFHVTFIDRAISISDSSMNKITMLELPIKSTVLFFPDSLTVWFTLMHVSLVYITIYVFKFTMIWKSATKVAFESRAVTIEIDSLSIWSSQLINIALVQPFVPLFANILAFLWLCMTHLSSHSW